MALVVNTGSRRGQIAFESTNQLLSDLFKGNVEAVAVHAGTDLGPTLDRIVSTRPDVLVIGGGDGSIGAAAHRLVHSDITLGVLPLGTANDFARTLGIPTDIPAAIDNLVHGKVVDVDIGRVDGRAYLNVASVGLSVAVTRRLTPGLKQRFGPLATRSPRCAPTATRFRSRPGWSFPTAITKR